MPEVFEVSTMELSLEADEDDFPALDDPDEEADVTFADIGYAGGPAPKETIRVGVSAGSSTDASDATITIDPWDLSVEGVDIL